MAVTARPRIVPCSLVETCRVVIEDTGKLNDPQAVVPVARVVRRRSTSTLGRLYCS
jgi:hypothetical protein